MKGLRKEENSWRIKLPKNYRRSLIELRNWGRNSKGLRHKRNVSEKKRTNYGLRRRRNNSTTLRKRQNWIQQWNSFQIKRKTMRLNFSKSSNNQQRSRKRLRGNSMTKLTNTRKKLRYWKEICCSKVSQKKLVFKHYKFLWWIVNQNSEPENMVAVKR